VIELNSIPVVFYPKGNTLGDDLVVGEKFPGGQAAFFDMLLATKQIQLGWHTKQIECLAPIYDRFAPTYDPIQTSSGLNKIQKYFAANFDFSGTVLDLACGTGIFGCILHDHGISAEITGVDISKGMVETLNIKNHYKHPIRIGTMEELIMGAGEFDHIVCWGALHFLEAVHLNAVLARMFMLARKSITFEIDDISQEYIDDLKTNHGFSNINNVEAMEEFGTPKGWRKVYHEREYIYKSPATNIDVSGYAMRFERI